ncbi:RHS repeat-associated core domain-containing protein, partial [Comamonas sp.]|uniref:RHS repeat-associated core domain-containing protein n=1 Tax=Comamonas sp. TaxID=34028 RepID=UPI00289E464A
AKIHYQYDSRGNRSQSLDEATGRKLELMYDSGNQLVQVVVTDNKKQTPQQYRYDAFGRRLAKYSMPANSAAGDVSETDYFGWDGDRLIHTERFNSANLQDSDGTAQPEVIHTIYEPGSFTPLIQLRRAAKAPLDLGEQLLANTSPGVVQDALRKALADIKELSATLPQNIAFKSMSKDVQIFMREQLQEYEQTLSDQRKEAAEKVEIRHYLCDHLGTPNALIREDSRLDWAVQLDAWGNVRAEHNPGDLYQPIRLPGQHADGETGLYYNRHRYYEPTNGGYATQDMLGVEGGINLGMYTGNPLKWIDPQGLSPVATNACVVDPITKQNVGRFIVDSRGNIIPEPVGGKTIPYPLSNPGSPDTHTLYANGSNAYRLNPQGHANNPTPHGHAHLPGTGPSRKGQGPSLDASGQQVPSNSAGAHIALKSLGAIDFLRSLYQMGRLKSCTEGGFGQCFCALNNTTMGHDERTSDNACMGNIMDL